MTDELLFGFRETFRAPTSESLVTPIRLKRIPNKLLLIIDYKRQFGRRQPPNKSVCSHHNPLNGHFLRQTTIFFCCN